VGGRRSVVECDGPPCGLEQLRERSAAIVRAFEQNVAVMTVGRPGERLAVGKIERDRPLEHLARAFASLVTS